MSIAIIAAVKGGEWNGRNDYKCKVYRKTDGICRTSGEAQEEGGKVKNERNP